MRCPKLRYAGLDFCEAPDPVARMESILVRLGFRSAGDARDVLRDRLPEDVLVAMPSRCRPALEVGAARPRSHLLDVLVEGLVLGLCSANLYDPKRPVVWTRTSLTRRLDLFDLGGFYAAD